VGDLKPRWLLSQRSRLQLFGRNLEFLRFVKHFEKAIDFQSSGKLENLEEVLDSATMEPLCEALLDRDTEVEVTMKIPVDPKHHKYRKPKGGRGAAAKALSSASNSSGSSQDDDDKALGIGLISV